MTKCLFFFFIYRPLSSVYAYTRTSYSARVSRYYVTPVHTRNANKKNHCRTTRVLTVRNQREPRTAFFSRSAVDVCGQYPHPHPVTELVIEHVCYCVIVVVIIIIVIIVCVLYDISGRLFSEDSPGRSSSTNTTCTV